MKKQKRSNLLAMVLAVTLTLVLCMPMSALATTNSSTIDTSGTNLPEISMQTTGINFANAPMPINVTDYPLKIELTGFQDNTYPIYTVTIDTNGDGVFGDAFPEDGSITLNEEMFGNTFSDALDVTNGSTLVDFNSVMRFGDDGGTVTATYSSDTGAFTGTDSQAYPMQISFSVQLVQDINSGSFRFLATTTDGLNFGGGELVYYEKGAESNILGSISNENFDANEIALNLQLLPTETTEYEVAFAPNSIYAPFFKGSSAAAGIVYAPNIAPQTSVTLPTGVAIEYSNATIDPASIDFNGETYDQFVAGDMTAYSEIILNQMNQALGVALAAKNLSIENMGDLVAMFDLSLTNATGTSYQEQSTFTVTVPVTGIANGTKVYIVHYMGINAGSGGVTAEIIESTVQNNSVTFETTGLSPYQMFLLEQSSSGSTGTTPTVVSPQTGVYN